MNADARDSRDQLTTSSKSRQSDRNNTRSGDVDQVLRNNIMLQSNPAAFGLDNTYGLAGNYRYDSSNARSSLNTIAAQDAVTANAAAAAAAAGFGQPPLPPLSEALHKIFPADAAQSSTTATTAANAQAAANAKAENDLLSTLPGSYYNQSIPFDLGNAYANNDTTYTTALANAAAAHNTHFVSDPLAQMAAADLPRERNNSQLLLNTSGLSQTGITDGPSPLSTNHAPLMPGAGAAGLFPSANFGQPSSSLLSNAVQLNNQLIQQHQRAAMVASGLAARAASFDTSASQDSLESPTSPDQSKVYSFVSLPGVNAKKRPRRRYDEIERLYNCNWPGCEKSYGTLNHLNAHVSMQKHGSKRHPNEFKELRKAWRKQKREEEERRDSK